MTTQLDSLEKRVRAGKTANVSVRELIGYFNAERRGTNVVWRVRRGLSARGLRTEPDFTDVWIDARVRVVLARPKEADANSDSDESLSPTASDSPSQTSSLDVASSPRARGAGLRLGGLRAATRPIAHVAPQTPLKVAITKMLLNDFSQLPVLQSERSCKGAVTWQSIARQRARGGDPATVDGCIEHVEILAAQTSLVDAIRHVVRCGFVLVRGANNILTGIVTTADLSEQFLELSEPFILIGQIETHLRALIERSFTVEEIKASKDPKDAGRVVKDASNLTFGEYVYLLRSGFEKLRLDVEPAPFLAELERVRDIRNDVVHFNTDPLEEEEYGLLRSFAKFLESVT